MKYTLVNPFELRCETGICNNIITWMGTIQGICLMYSYMPGGTLGPVALGLGHISGNSYVPMFIHVL